MRSPARILAPLGLSLVALIPAALGGACATAVENGNTGGGSSSSAASSGPGGGGEDAGPDARADAASGACSMATDCSAMNDPCNVGACVNGTCVKAPANEHGSCDDGLFCTENDSCINGVCVGGSTKPCSPPDSCHIGVCDEATDSCAAMPGNDGAQCDDMDACTLQGTCSAGACVKGNPVDCSVFNTECATGQCMPGQGCVPVPINEGGLCNDGKPPTGCSQGLCQMGTCTSTPKNDGQPCNDNLFCTINDHCQSANCVGDPNPCAPPNNACQIGVCDENQKSCTVGMAPNGTACDDGSNCTTGESCSSGQCVGGQPANNGAACDDHNGCTTGTTCSNGACGNPQGQINACIAGDNCCPANCNFAQDADCLYWQSGVQQNVPVASLAGWTQCFIDTYADSATSLATILGGCSGSKLLLACRPTGSQTLTLVAMGNKTDVTFDTGTGNVTHNANGMEWYYNSSYSWGFAPAGDPVNRNSCDIIASNNSPGGADGDKRLCWHTGAGNINGGWRCGTSDNLNGSSSFERIVYQAP